MNDNSTDIFLEVDHGPMLVSNNILLSRSNLSMNSSGAAFVYNLFAGQIDVIHYDARLTPYLKPHSTYVVAFHDNPSGDVRFINNLFVNGADASRYDSAMLPVVFDGNVYTKGGGGAIENGGGKEIYLEMDFDKNWLAQKCKPVTTETFFKAMVPDLPFEDVDGSPLRIDIDYLGEKRSVENPSAGPFETRASGRQRIEVWQH
jgi:hypothetical protein